MSRGSVAHIFEDMNQPKYLTVAEALAERIAAGRLQPGSVLPSEAELATEFGVSKSSARNAINHLASAGMIRVIHGRGSFVKLPPRRIERNSAARYEFEKSRVLNTHEDRLSTGAVEFDTGLEASDLEFSAEYQKVPATDEVALTFGVDRGTDMLERTYLTGHRGENPLSIVVSLMPYNQAARNPMLLDSSNEPWPGGTLHQLATLGIEVADITDVVTARMPTISESRLLDMDLGTPLLVIRKLARSTEGEMVDHTSVLLPGDRTQAAYDIPLKPWPDDWTDHVAVIDADD